MILARTLSVMDWYPLPTGVPEAVVVAGATEVVFFVLGDDMTV